ncbi:MAG: M48 family metallopeptidase, partial [Thermodesulfobacteriota bacterium]|nr:M48 family metallopeptidase [Thermodesulfobacteriota bacterium]
NPITLKQELMFYDDESEIKLGKKVDKDILKEYGYYNDEKLQNYINEVGQRIAKVSDRNYLDYHFTVLDTPLINAFALPGGYIYITRELLAFLNSEAELAGVLAHEVGHVVGRDSINQLSRTRINWAIALASLAAIPMTAQAIELAAVTNTLMTSINLGYSREKEFQADKLSIKYTYKSGYDPYQITYFMKNLLRKGHSPTGYEIYLSSHPNMENRIMRTLAEAKITLSLNESMYDDTQPEKARLNVLSDKYKTYLEGLPYGDKKSDNYKKFIKIYTAKGGERLDQIVLSCLQDPNMVKEISELNNLQPDSILYSKQKIKLIVNNL